jgi:aminopeptidase N
MADHGELYRLTQQEAQLRGSIVSNVKYDLRQTLSKSESYAGHLLVSFTSSDDCSSLWLDFKGSKVDSLTVNSTVIEVVHKNNQIRLGQVRKGENLVEIVFHNKYSRDGLGLHYFKDPEDQEVYLYTQFEPFSANRMFPCFDQPDLKALFDFVVKAPASWKVISNENAVKVAKEYERPMPVVEGYSSDEEELVHVFPGKFRLSTYLYALCAGAYVEHRHDQNEVGLPLGLYCRKSMDKYLVPERYFHWTVEGQKFYKEFFDFPYPFSKYDQVFVPEFNMGAMENVGCVTYRDQYIFKDPPSDVQLHRVCNTFLHEMAHMWFGNLVTMKWWDDLWLNESFATFMSSLAIDTQLTSQFPAAWREFLGSKGWGYATDQLSTTHPISTPVGSTTETETNFDGISYSKGSAVLKQLYFLVGGKVFQRAMGRYMKRFQFNNAEFGDLIKFIGAAAFEDGNSLDIQAWAASWILTAGLNELRPCVSYNDGKIEQLVIEQTPALSAHATLRNHTIIVEAFDHELRSVKKVKVLVKAQSQTTVEELAGVQASVVILNVEDWGYCKIRIDEASLTHLKKNLIKIEDPLTRQLVYRALWDMVRDIKLSAVEFVEFVIQQFPHETDSGIANYSLEITNAALYNYIPSCIYKETLAHQVFSMILSRIQGPLSKESSMIYQKALKLFIYHPDDIKLALNWVEQKSTNIENFTLGQLDRWSIIKKFSGISSEAAKYVAAEVEHDLSDTGRLSKLYCESAYPDKANKERVWTEIMENGEKLSRYERESIMSGFNVERQREVLEEFGQKFFDIVLNVVAERDKEFYIDFTSHLIPTFMEDAWVIEKMEEIIPKFPEDKFEVVREMKEAAEYLRKFKNGKELSRSYINANGY